MNTYQAQGLSGEFEFEADTQEFEDTEFGEAEYGEAEFEDTEYEDEWTGEVRDHRRPGASRTSYRPSPRYPRSPTAPQPVRWGTRTNYGVRPVSRSNSWSNAWSRPQSRSWYRPSGQRYSWAQPGGSSQWYRGGQYPGRYWRFGQNQNYPGATPGWGNWGSWGRWRRRYPYGYGSAYAQPYYDEPIQPPYDEPPMPPPPVIVAPPPPPPMAPMAPPPESPQAPPLANTPQPGQDQAQSGEFFLEPEAFEYQPEFGEYEAGWGEMEGPYGESEGADEPPPLLGTYEPKLLTGPCPTYLPREEARSKTDAGHLPTDVFVGPDRLLIADFGVDWRHVKPVAARDPKLTAWLTSMIARTRSDSTVGLSIFGFSDCVGTVSHNMFLRQGRAERTRQLLLTLAAPADRAFLDSRIFSATAADPAHFLADNGTVAGRAKNRAAIILATPVIRIHGTPPGPPGPTLYARRR